jgi:hypothetical protein
MRNCRHAKLGRGEVGTLGERPWCSGHESRPTAVLAPHQPRQFRGRCHLRPRSRPSIAREAEGASRRVPEPSDRDPKSPVGCAVCAARGAVCRRLVLCRSLHGFRCSFERTPHGDPGAATSGEAELTMRSAVLQLVSAAARSRPSRPDTRSAPHTSSPSMHIVRVWGLGIDVQIIGESNPTSTTMWRILDP